MQKRGTDFLDTVKRPKGEEFISALMNLHLEGLTFFKPITIMEDASEYVVPVGQHEFKEVVNPEKSAMKVRVLRTTDKAVQCELQLTIWLPKKVITLNADGSYTIPSWIISKSIK